MAAAATATQRPMGFGENSMPKPRMARTKPRNSDDRTEWRPVTNLGRLVKAGYIKSIEEIFLNSFTIKEVGIVDYFFARKRTSNIVLPEEDSKPSLHDEVLGVSPVQKQSSSGQRTRFRALVIVGDYNGHVGFGAKRDKEVAGAIRGAIMAAKLSIFPVRRGYWGNKIGKPHTVPMKVTGKCASVVVRLIPAPRGTGIVGSPIAKKVLGFAGVHDCFINTNGHTRTTGNFIAATIAALERTYQILTPDLWSVTASAANPLDVYADVLEKSQKERM